MSFEGDVYAWCRELMASSPERRPFVLGVNGPQGAGKTTLARGLEERCARDSLRAVAVSIDDFYLTGTEQRALAAAHPSNPYLQSRGYPGTHDVALGTATMRALKSLTRPDAEVAVPVYDKAVNGGRGDRRPASDWRTVRGPLDLVIFEGWMLGFAKLKRGFSDAALAAVNDRLPPYDAWSEVCDGFLQLRMAAPESVVDWRVEAEASRRATGGGALSDDEARRYVATFLPAYALYPDALEKTPPVEHGRSRVVWLGKDREPCLPCK